MMKLYDDDTELREILRSFLGLALLPVDSIDEGHEILKQIVSTSSHSRQLDPFVAYFENEWFSVFKPTVWCVKKSMWRTDNYVEGKIK